MAGSGLKALPERLKDFARSLGFAFAGLTSPAPPPHLAEYERWLTEGCHGEMAYLSSERARQRRADPRLILPECKTILVAALPYTPGDAVGPIAAYARGDDYHDVLPRKLARVLAWLEVETGRRIAHKIYADTGPLLERELAQRAGLGWIGKNTMLINPAGGSYFLLGELLIDLQLPADPPFAPDLCGSCTRCLDACPTEAIRPDRTLDARRCISYLTIELKGEIPEDLRPGMGGWIFGCDICQAVCPWNLSFAGNLTPDPGLAPRPAPQPLQAELGLTAGQFNARFRRSPIKRAKRRGYLRNVSVALGNTASAEAVPALAACAELEAEPLVRAHAAWALQRLQRRTQKPQGPALDGPASPP